MNEQVSEEYNVELPDAGFVYYDTVLDATVRVREVDVDQRHIEYASAPHDDIQYTTEPLDRFFAWLAAERFVKLGEQTGAGEVESTAGELARVYRHRFDVDPRQYDGVELARRTLSDELDAWRVSLLPESRSASLD